MKTSVRELTRAVASGDPEALAQLYETHVDAMLAHARRITGRDDDFCFDIVQDAMMKVIRVIKPIDTDAALRSWLRCVVKSCAYDRLRSERRRARREQNSPAANNHRPHDDGTDLDERLAWLRDQLERLDADSSHLIHLRHRLGWTLQRIGKYLGLSPGAVDGRLTRALRKLQTRAEHFDD